MYWISISTISALVYLYCKGKKSKTIQWTPPETPDLDAPDEAAETGTAAPAEKETSPEEAFSDHVIAEDEDKKIDVTEKGDEEKSLREGIEENGGGLRTETAGGKIESREADQEAKDPAESWKKSEHILAMESLPETADPWQWHTVYTRGIEEAYKNRTAEPRMMDIVIIYGERYLSRFPLIKSTVFEQLGDRSRPISIFKYLAIVLDEAEAYDDAIRVCNTAIRHGIVDGTRTGFTGRIQRISQKKASSSATDKQG